MKKLLLGLLCIFLTACVPSYTAPGDLTPSDIESYRAPEDMLELHFIDVGQGDSTLIRAGETTLLIDAGTGESEEKLVSYLKSIGATEIDIFISTHPHEDHLGGGAKLLRETDVKSVYMSEEASSSYFFEKFVDALLERNITPSPVDTGCVYKTDDFEFEFLTDGTQFENTNDNSLVILVTYKEKKFLFTGDAEKAPELFLTQKGEKINSDLLKIGHHGSRFASQNSFLNAVSPSVAIISCGEGNSYGHPHEETLNRLDNFKIKTYRTDISGDIRIYCDGNKLYDDEGNVIENSFSEISYIGNRKSKKFHWEDCAGKPASKNSVSFKTREDAIRFGYSPCKTCNP